MGWWLHSRHYIQYTLILFINSQCWHKGEYSYLCEHKWRENLNNSVLLQFNPTFKYLNYIRYIYNSFTVTVFPYIVPTAGVKCLWNMFVKVEVNWSVSMTRLERKVNNKNTNQSITSYTGNISKYKTRVRYTVQECVNALSNLNHILP